MPGNLKRGGISEGPERGQTAPAKRPVWGGTTRGGIPRLRTHFTGCDCYCWVFYRFVGGLLSNMSLGNKKGVGQGKKIRWGKPSDP